MEFFTPEEFLDSFLYSRHTRHTTDQNDLVNIRWFETGIIQGLLHRTHGTLDQISGQLL